MDAIYIFFAVIFIAILSIAAIFFSISLHKALKLVPPSQLVFPVWFVWMFFVPLAGYVFFWLMLPFGVPRSFFRAVPNNLAAQKRARTLFALGLSYCILLILNIIPYLTVVFLLPSILIWIIYWAKVVKFRKLFLDSRPLL